MNVVFRADASDTIGFGHIMRCLTLARQFEELGANIYFFCRDIPDNLIKKIIQKGYCLKLIGQQSNVSYIENFIKEKIKHYKTAPYPYNEWLDISWEQDVNSCILYIKDIDEVDIIIVDSYSIDFRWENIVSKHVNYLVAIDDLANRAHYCNLLIDQTLGCTKKNYLNLVPKTCSFLLGCDYVILRPEFLGYRKESIKKLRSKDNISNILINFGGLDPDFITRKILELIGKIEDTTIKRIDIVIGSDSKSYKKVKELSQFLPYKVNIYSDIDNMAEILSKADLVIGGVGSSAWERCCLGIPSILVVCAENQLNNAKKLVSIEAADILSYSTEISDFHKEKLYKLIINASKLKRNGLIASKLCDGSGVDRIINYLLPRKSKDNRYVKIRPVTINDKELVYSWQVLPNTRKYSRSPDIPNYKEHSVWFEKKLKDNNYFYIILHETTPSGVVRLDSIERVEFLNVDIKNQLYEISVYVSDDQYGKGLASIAIAKIESLIPKSTIMAYVSKQNRASQKLFEKSGYKKIQESIYVKYTI